VTAYQDFAARVEEWCAGGRGTDLFSRLLRSLTQALGQASATTGTVDVTGSGTIDLTEAQLLGSSPLVLVGVLSGDRLVRIPNMPLPVRLIQNGTTGMHLLALSTVSGSGRLQLARTQIKDFWSTGGVSPEVQSSDPYSYLFRSNVSLVGAIGNHDTPLLRVPQGLLITRADLVTTEAVAGGGTATAALGSAAPFTQVLDAAVVGALGTVIGEDSANFGTSAFDTGSVQILADTNLSLRNAVSIGAVTAGELEVTVLGLLTGSTQ